jgi:hypothetical protein
MLAKGIVHQDFNCLGAPPQKQPEKNPEIWSIAVDGNLEDLRGDLGAVLELHASDDISEQCVAI